MFICNFPTRNIITNGTISIAVGRHSTGKLFNMLWPSPAFLSEVTDNSRQAEHLIYPGFHFLGFVECIYNNQRTAMITSVLSWLRSPPLITCFSLIYKCWCRNVFFALLFGGWQQDEIQSVLPKLECAFKPDLFTSQLYRRWLQWLQEVLI